MNFPSLQVNNFFDNPDYILNYANSLTYEKENLYPGTRTKPLHILNKELFKDINSKIIRLLYPKWDIYSQIEWSALSMFQKINYDDVKLHMLNEKNPGKGWVHNDNEIKFTAIVYLSKGKDNGTAIYSKDDGFTLVRVKEQQIKYDYYNGKEQSKDIYLQSLNENINSYNIECLFNSSYNKLIGFDGSNPHGAFFNLKPDDERITFISFFTDIIAPYFPVPEMRRV